MPDEDDLESQIEELGRKLKELERLYKRLSETKELLRIGLDELKAAFHQG